MPVLTLSLLLCPPDLTFVHEGSKTLLDGLVNVEKLVSRPPPPTPWRKRPLDPILPSGFHSPGHLGSFLGKALPLCDVCYAQSASLPQGAHTG